MDVRRHEEEKEQATSKQCSLTRNRRPVRTWQSCEPVSALQKTILKPLQRRRPTSLVTSPSLLPPPSPPSYLVVQP